MWRFPDFAAALCVFAGLAMAESFDSHGVPIVYTVEGKGAPVILVHGLYSSANINWRLPGTIQALSAQNQVIAFDLRGHGRSGKPESPDAYGIELAEDVIRLMDHLKIQKANLAGYSLGGMITMKLLTRHPDRIQSAVLGGMGWLRQGSPLADFWAQLPQSDRSSRTPSGCVRSLGALAVTEAEVRAIRVPVTVLVGDHDPCRRLYVVPLQRIRPDWTVTVIPDAGHLNCIAKPEFRTALKSWLGQRPI